MFAASIIGIYFSLLFLMLLNALTTSILDFRISLDFITTLGAVLTCWVYFGVLSQAMGKAA